MQEGEQWHLVEARRDDGSPALFRIRELAARPELPTIFVVEMPFASTEMSDLPNAAQYRRLDGFRDQWLLPACTAHGWVFVAQKIEDGAFFLYLYGNGDPDELVARFTPFDPDLSFYDDADPQWAEYAYLRELLDEAMQLPAAPKPKAPTTKRPEPKVRETKKPTTSPLGKRAPKATLSEAKAGGAKAAKAKVAKPAKAKKFRR